MQLHQVGRRFAIEVVQEAEELLMPVPRFALGQNGAVGHVQRSKQGGRSVPVVVVRHAFNVTQRPIGKTGCVRSVAGIWLFSSTHSTRVFSGGWIQVQADDVPDLVDEQSDCCATYLRDTTPGRSDSLPINRPESSVGTTDC